MENPFEVVRKFEKAIADYCEAPDAVACTSCTTAILMAACWKKKELGPRVVSIPRFTYIGVVQSIHNAGHAIAFRDEIWKGQYVLDPLDIVDSARRLTSGMYKSGTMACLSLHWAKHLSVGQGGVILLDDPVAAAWLRKCRFDGRTEGVSPKDDEFIYPAFHAYMMPRDAAEALTKLAILPKHNEDLPNSDYADLSKCSLFR